MKELLAALIKFQSEVGSIEKSENNPFYGSKYANLDSILTVIRPLLAKHDLCINQFAIPGGNSTISVKTILWHSTGQFMESDCIAVKPSKLDVQGYGGCITYLKRYMLGSLLQLSFEVDDDGNSQVKQTAPKSTTAPSETSTQPKRSGRI